MLDLPEPLKIDKIANNVNLHIVVHIYVFHYWHFSTPGFDLMALCVLQKQTIIITFHILDFNLKGSYQITFHILHVNGYGWVDR